MYYLKYRPQKIADIDNVSRKELFLKLFSAKDIPHAFLFVGSKGTGKTSTARIIAKILNCEQNSFAGKNTSPEPCLECDNCKQITAGSFLDVYELDGASNRGIDDIRQLRDQLNYAPSKGRYKIYIIDEVHMLTKEAFNALLKTLEEPPSFVVFILATTEEQKLPETIVSRCIQVNFSKANEEELVNSLKRITTGEKLKVPETLLKKVAFKAQGSFRDAAKILETLVTTTNLSELNVDAYFQNGINSNPKKFLECLLTKDEKNALLWLQTFEEQGGSSTWLIEELLNLLHDLLLLKKGVETNQTLTIKDFSPAIISSGTVPTISKLVKLLLDTYQLCKYSPNEYLPLMTMVVELGK